MSELRRRQKSAAGGEAGAKGEAAPGVATIADAADGHLGITLCDAEFSIGVAVEAVVFEDLCAKAGLRPGHVITAVNGTAVKDHATCLSLLDSAGQKDISYLSAAAYADRLADERAKSKAANKKLFSFLAVVMLLIAGVGYAFAPQITDAVTKFANQAQGAPTGPPSPPPPPPKKELPPLDPFDYEVKKSELERKAKEMEAEYPQFKMVGENMLKRVTGDEKLDPREAIDMLSMIQKEMGGYKAMMDGMNPETKKKIEEQKAKHEKAKADKAAA
jgi:hypothetical protein